MFNETKNNHHNSNRDDEPGASSLPTTCEMSTKFKMRN